MLASKRIPHVGMVEERPKRARLGKIRDMLDTSEPSNLLSSTNKRNYDLIKKKQQQQKRLILIIHSISLSKESKINQQYEHETQNLASLAGNFQQDRFFREFIEILIKMKK